MNPEPERIWKNLAAKIQRAEAFHNMRPEEAEAELRDAPDKPLSDAEIDAIVDTVTSGELAVWEPTPSLDWLDGIDTKGVSEDVLQLNRNAGDADPDTDALIEELRRKALEGNEPDDELEQDGVDGDGTPSGDGQ